MFQMKQILLLLLVLVSFTGCYSVHSKCVTGSPCYVNYYGEEYYWDYRYRAWVGPRGHFVEGRYHRGYPVKHR